MGDKIYILYKRIMKHDPKAVDEIESFEEAKEIIKLIAGNVYLNGEIYNTILNSEVFVNEKRIN